MTLLAPAAGRTAPDADSGVGVSCRGLVYIYRLEGYDVVALAGVDLDISPGESVALLGPSGSGKSTLLSVLAGLLTPSAGRLIVGDRDITRATPAELAQLRATQVGVVLQGTSRNLLPYLSAEQNVRFAQRGAARRETRLPAAREVLSLVGLSGRGRGRMRPHHLTPGERQRLALAVALANRPGLLLADEPTSQLDSRARDEVLGALEAVRAAGTTVVVVTHDPSVGLHMGRTVTIRDGRVGAEGRRGEDYAVVGRDGSIHLPTDVLKVFMPGTLVEVFLDPDGTARLVPAGSTGSRRRVVGQPEQAHIPAQHPSLDYAGPEFSAFGAPEPVPGGPELSYGAALSASEPAYGGYGSARGTTETGFGAAVSGRTSGAAEPSRSFGTAEPSPSFGTAEPGRSFGAAESSPSFGAAESSRSFGTAESSPSFGAAESSRSFGAAEPGRSFGTPESSPSFGTAESSRSFGTAEPGRPIDPAEPGRIWGAAEPDDADRRGPERDDGDPAGPVRRRSGLTFGSSPTDGADPFDYWGEER